MGLDHGVGHPLLLLYDAKAPNGQNTMNSRAYTAIHRRLFKYILDLNQTVSFVQLFDFSSFSSKLLK